MRQLVNAASIVVWALWSVSQLSAQVTYTTANSHTSVVPRAFGFFSFDFVEAQLGLTFVHEPGTTCRFGECDEGGFGFGLYAGAAARKGQDDLFSSLAFNPGLSGGGRLTYTLRQDGFGYDLLYLSAGYSSTQQKLAELNPQTTVLSLTERDKREVIGSVGYNRALARGTVLGVRLAGRREFESVGTAVPEEVCVPGTVDFSGFTYPVCSDRYTRETVEPLPNLWGWHARADFQVGLTEIASAESVPMFAIVGAASVDKLETANTTYHWAIGGAIVPAAYPGQTMVALLAGFNDATNANGVAQGFNDRFVVSLTVGLPFEMILTRR